MRTYVSEFLKEFQYPKDASEVLLSAYDRITENAEAKDLWEQTIALYETDYNCEYRDIIGNADKVANLLDIHEFTLELLIFICLSKHLKELYIEKGISLDFYRRSMLDLRYKLDECQLVYGIVGTFVAIWYRGFFNLTRFGMGRLQFEVTNLGGTYEKNGISLTPESKVINVHIPRSGEPLTEEACMEAYLLAKEFFKDQIETEPCPFKCDSWLLDPHILEILPKTTNTYRFCKSFDIYSTSVDKGLSNLWRLFDTMEKNPDKLPADTSMRRAFVDYLKKGGKLCTARGVLFV